MRTGWLRSGGTTLGAAGICACLLASARASWALALALGPGALRPADLLLALLSSGGALLAAWLTAGLVLAVLARAPGALGRGCAAVADRVTPAAARKTVALLLGTSLTAALAPGTAVAAPSASGRHPVATTSLTAPSRGDDRAELSSSASAPAGAPDPGFRPTPRASTPASLDPLHAPARSPHHAADGYVVRRGDTLWDIAARTLGPGASASAVAREWPRWYAENRAVIGPDPSLLRPGQRLQPPPAQGGAR